MANTDQQNAGNKGGSSWLWIVAIIVGVIVWSHSHEVQDEPTVRVQVSFQAVTLPNVSGSEALVKNTNNEAENISVTLLRPSDGETKTFDYTIAENDYQEIGSSKGSAFQSGDQLTASETGYKSESYDVGG